MHFKLIHIDLTQRVIDPAADLLRRNAQVFGRKRHIVLDDIGDYLVIRVLKHHADGAAYLKQPILIGSAYAVNEHLALGGQQDGVQMLCKCAFPGAVVPQNSDKASLFNIKAHTAQALVLVARIGVMHIFYTYDVLHISPLPTAGSAAG